jgi:transposase
MGQQRTRRKFSAEFKAQAVNRVLDGKRSLTDVATELGLSTGQLSTWRAEPVATGSAEALAMQKADAAELQRIKREVRRLEQANTILRKAAAVFAKGIA